MRAALISVLVAALGLIPPRQGLSGQFTLYEKGGTSIDLGGYVLSLTQL